MHRGAAQIPYLAQEMWCLTPHLTHLLLFQPCLLCLAQQPLRTRGPSQDPSKSSISLLPPNHPLSFLVPRWKVCHMQPIFQILNNTNICLQAKVMTGLQEPDHTKRDKLEIHPDSSSHSYSGPIAETSIPKDIWINHWQQTRGRKIQTNTHHVVITWQCANTPTCPKRRAHRALFSKHKGI